MEIRGEKAIIKATSQEGKSQQSGANTGNYFWFAAPSVGCHSPGKQPLFRGLLPCFCVGKGQTYRELRQGSVGISPCEAPKSISEKEILGSQTIKQFRN